jgi:hypothetical protein
MLTEEQRILLAKIASEKYQLDINSAQIAHLILDRFECKLNFGKENNIIKGKVEDFRNFPLRIEFEAPKGSPGRKALKTALQENLDLKFSCKLSTVSHTVKINTFSISSSEFQEMGIQEKLLGPASSAYVSRKQLNLLAGQLYSTLNIFEEYEMPENQFNLKFVEDFVRLAADQQFKHVRAMQALKELSSFGFQIGQDLHPGNLNLQYHMPAIFFHKIIIVCITLNEM